MVSCWSEMRNILFKVTYDAAKAALPAILVCLLPVCAGAQSYDLLLKGGHVIDPKNGIDQSMDLGIKGKTIARVARDIPPGEALKVIDVSGLYVVPGLIDPHAHVFFGSDPEKGFNGGASSVSPDAFSFRSGITTIVDAGDAGWRNFPDFRKQVIEQSDTRVLAFINIFGHGLTSGSGIYKMDDIDIDSTLSMVRRYPDDIVGVRIGHFLGKSWVPFEAALKSAQQSNRPLLLECHTPELSLDELLERMRPGDIFTHAFGAVNDRLSILDEEDKIQSYVLEAREQGIVFDVGHGGGSFHYSLAVPASEQGLFPDTFGTDLHRYSMNGGMKDMLNIMSTYLTLGQRLKEVIAGGSWKAAKAIQRSDLGHLDEGGVADIAVLKVEKGNFGYVDSGGNRIDGNKKLNAELTIREGEIVWDQNGLSAKRWQENQ
ncbi:amidohydrolase/deacetylase family metallohydrolase [Fodinibius sediminis]|nr:amidohydrolase/deacetylase family metallohydrolase [Fodinibius sediminis]